MLTVTKYISFVMRKMFIICVLKFKYELSRILHLYKIKTITGSDFNIAKFLLHYFTCFVVSIYYSDHNLFCILPILTKYIV